MLLPLPSISKLHLSSSNYFHEPSINQVKDEPVEVLLCLSVIVIDPSSAAARGSQGAEDSSSHLVIPGQSFFIRCKDSYCDDPNQKPGLVCSG